MSEEEQKKHLIAPPNIDISLKQALQKDFFLEGSWPETNWWNMFTNEELSFLIEKALKNNFSLQSIDEKINQAKQEAIKVRSTLFPLIFFDAEANWQYLSKNGLYKTLNPHIPSTGDLVDLSLSFEYEFDFWGKNRNMYKAALGKEKIQKAENAQAELIISTALAQVYFSLKTNFLRKKLYRNLYTHYCDILEIQKKLQTSALVSRLPILLSEEKVEEIQKLLFSIEEEIHLNTHMINVLCGENPDTSLDLSSNLYPFTEAISLPNDLSLNLLSRRPDLMAAIWRVESLAYEVGAAKADFFPNINLKGLAGLESFHFSNLFKWSSKALQLLPAIHLPIFTAGKIRANVREKKALFDEAVYTYNQLLLDSAKEVVDALILIQTVSNQKISQKKILQFAKERLHLTQMRFASGLENSIEIYWKKIEWLDKKLEDIQLTYTQYASIVKLIKSLGGGYKTKLDLPLKKEVEEK